MELEARGVHAEDDLAHGGVDDPLLGSAAGGGHRLGHGLEGEQGDAELGAGGHAVGEVEEAEEGLAGAHLGAHQVQLGDLAVRVADAGEDRVLAKDKSL